MIARQDRRTTNRSTRNSSQPRQYRQRVYANQTRRSAIRVDKDRNTLSEKEQQRTDVLARQSDTDWSQFDTRRERRNVKKSFKRERRDTGKQVRLAKKESHRSVKVNQSSQRRQRRAANEGNRHGYARNDRHYNNRYGYRGYHRGRGHHDDHSSDGYYGYGHPYYSTYGYGHPYYGSYAYGYGYPYYGSYGTNYVSVYSPVVVGSSYSYAYDDSYVDGDAGSVDVGDDSYGDGGYVIADEDITYNESYADEGIAVYPVNHVTVYGGPPVYRYGFWNLWASPYAYHRYRHNWYQFRTWWQQDYWPNTFWGGLSLHFNF